MITVQSLTGLGKASDTLLVGIERNVGIYLLRIIREAIGYRLLNPFEILMDISLLF